MTDYEKNEELLTITEVLDRLSIGSTTFYKYKSMLIAFGLQEVKIGKVKRFRASSLDRCIRKLAESEIA